MVGIYKFTNKINGKIYIGQSNNIEKRKQNHVQSSYNKNAGDYNTFFHQAIRKYGIENFDFEVLVTLDENDYTRKQLDELEIYYIAKYDSYKRGYNATPGGSGRGAEGQKGELNGRALLTKDDVVDIRESYNNHERFKDVYERYKDKISIRGFQNVWWFNTWKHICPEYNTKANKEWQKHQAKANPPEVARNNKRAFTPEQVRQMRNDFDNGMTPKQVQQKYAPEKRYSTIYNIVNRITYKDID